MKLRRSLLCSGKSAFEIPTAIVPSTFHAPNQFRQTPSGVTCITAGARGLLQTREHCLHRGQRKKFEFDPTSEKSFASSAACQNISLARETLFNFRRSAFTSLYLGVNHVSLTFISVCLSWSRKYFATWLGRMLWRSWLVCLRISDISSSSLRACCFHKKSREEAISTCRPW